MRRLTLGAAATGLVGLVTLAVGCSAKSYDRGGGAAHGGAGAGSAGLSATGGSGGSGNASGTSGGSGAQSGGRSANAGANGGSANGGSSGASANGASASGGTNNAGAGGAGSSTSGTGGSGGKATGGTAGASAGTGGANGGSSSGGEAGQSSDACQPNDEFEDGGLDRCWSALNGSEDALLIGIQETGGALHLNAHGSQNGVWYQGATESLVYQVVTSTAFKLTTTAHPRKVTDATALPTKDLHVGGLMVRNPSSMGGSTENYLFIMVGHSENNNGMVHQGVEFKSTFNGCSDWLEPDWGTAHDAPDADLRICRIGAEFRNYKRVPGDATWTLADAPSGNCSGNVVDGGVLTRSDMPDTVEVGLALNFNAPSDLDVAFDYIHFSKLPANATADDCTSD